MPEVLGGSVRVDLVAGCLEGSDRVFRDEPGCFADAFWVKVLGAGVRLLTNARRRETDEPEDYEGSDGVYRSGWVFVGVLWVSVVRAGVRLLNNAHSAGFLFLESGSTGSSASQVGHTDERRGRGWGSEERHSG